MYQAPFSQIADAFTNLLCRSTFWQFWATATAWLALYFLLPLGIFGRLASEVRGGVLPRVLGGRPRVVETLADAYPRFSYVVRPRDASRLVPDSVVGGLGVRVQAHR